MPGKLNRSALLILAIAGFLLLSLGGWVAWSGVRTDVDGMNQRAVPALIAVTDISTDYRELRAVLQGMAQEPDAGEREVFRERYERDLLHLQGGLAALRGLGMSSPALDEVTEAYQQAAGRTAMVAMTGQRDAAHALVYSSLIPAERQLQAYIDEIRREVQAQQKAVAKSLSLGGFKLLAYSIASLCLGLGLWMLLAPPVAVLVPAGHDVLLSREIAAVLYGYTGSVVPASLVTSAALVTVFLGHPERIMLYCWWAVSLGVLTARTTAYLRWHAVRDTDFDGPTAIRHFSAGALAMALVWGCFPVLFFAEASALQRIAMAFVFAAMAGAGAAVLAPLRRISLLYLSLMLLPQVLLFAAEGSRLDVTVAVLSMGLLVMLAASAMAARQTTLSALLLSRENKRLAEESVLRQLELEQLNTTLEDRVHERTVQLEVEMDARESYADQLKELALHDPLTGLLNRRALAGRMDEVLARAAGIGMGVQVLFIDLDRFKDVNDVQGHFVGDQVLIELAQRLRRTLPEAAVVARWGGDEFVVVVPAPAGLNHAGGIRAAIMEPVRVRDHEVRLDASIGISLFPEQGTDVDVLVRQADVAMYQVKLKGRSGVQLYDPAMGDSIRRQHELGQALREAMAHDALSLVFQPVVPEVAGHALKMEALLRWEHPVRGVISPAEFIPVAEDGGLIGPLGRWVLFRACHEALAWSGDTVIAVNVSALQVMSGELLGDVADALRETGLPPHRLELELTESVFAHDFGAISRVFGALREMGIRIAIDDFGTGYSSLSYLYRLPIDAIKIDRSFVRDSEHTGDQMLRAILGMARGFGYGVVAEGVETELQRDMLLRMEVDFIQGACHAPPMLPEAAVEWTRNYTLNARSAVRPLGKVA
ncbi:putative bifunctional diguanylate cyclase/phosphodiesterase [Uliginosibacterium aquaticum]|uniref:EAL domain-containing protein n=1 Tax=Uliginosibacterium aquaticum TaxID=2731212 RepID=A0ABX2IPC4_9RHOO|nr:EAL domain-containing protein [Uliginosibacterium aquaticum]NSL56108.1 EAL domain-containing protein [Uliginosibacterium aquaticum]